MSKSISPDTIIGPYRIVSQIGEGGMGEVYRARDTRLDREVAIKLLPASVSSDSDRLQRFAQEARATSALNHPNILTIYDIGTHEETPFIVAELLEGSEVRELLNDGPLPSRKALDYAQQVAHGLAAAHEKGIVHRDLKPENLFVTDDGRVKILDFGLAKLRPQRNAVLSSDIETQKQITDPGTVTGTVGYMAPEQVRGHEVDHRSDIFSFGSILYEMLSGQRAFKRETMAETMTAILKEEPPELRSLVNLRTAVAPRKYSLRATSLDGLRPYLQMVRSSPFSRMTRRHCFCDWHRLLRRHKCIQALHLSKLIANNKTRNCWLLHRGRTEKNAMTFSKS